MTPKAAEVLMKSRFAAIFCERADVVTRATVRTQARARFDGTAPLRTYVRTVHVHIMSLELQCS